MDHVIIRRERENQFTVWRTASPDARALREIPSKRAFTLFYEEYLGTVIQIGVGKFAAEPAEVDTGAPAFSCETNQSTLGAPEYPNRPFRPGANIGEFPKITFAAGALLDHYVATRKAAEETRA